MDKNKISDKPLAEVIEHFIGIWALCSRVDRTKEATESLARLGHALKQIPDTIHWTPPTDEQVQSIVDEAKQTGRFGVL